MQKKLIALAVAGLASTAAFAQTNVTIYGVADLGYVASSSNRNGTTTGNANYNGIDSGIWGGSRIGFKGEEALGNGLKTIFTLEYYIAPDENTGVGAAPETTGAGGSGSNSRQTFVGLSHNKLGTVTFGRQYAPGFYSQVRNDAFAGASIGALAVANGAGANSIVAGNAARLSNSALYTSPNWNGFTVAGGYSWAEGGLSTNNGVSQGNDGVLAAGLNYANGPLNLDVVYQQRQSKTAAVTAGIAAAGGQAAIPASAVSQDNVNEWMVGGSYDFKVVKLFATYQDQNDNNNSATDHDGASNKVWSLGAAMPVFGNGKIHASFARVDWDKNGAGNSDIWALGYSHALSKRTTLYTTYTSADNDRNVLKAAGPVGNTAFRDERNSTFTAGINHAF